MLGSGVAAPPSTFQQKECGWYLLLTREDDLMGALFFSIKIRGDC